MNRRGFLTGLGAGILAAPAIVRASSLDPLSFRKFPVEVMRIDAAGNVGLGHYHPALISVSVRETNFGRDNVEVWNTWDFNHPDCPIIMRHPDSLLIGNVREVTEVLTIPKWMAEGFKDYRRP